MLSVCDIRVVRGRVNMERTNYLLIQVQLCIYLDSKNAKFQKR